MRKMLFILFLSSSLSLFSQTTNVTGLTYAYDSAGNRISRTITLGTGLKSSSAPEEETFFTETMDYLNQETEVRIYPNPTKGRFAIEINNVQENVTGQIYLLNSQGRILDKKDIRSEGKFDFDLSRETTGIYLVNIHLGEAVSTWKIIKQ